jgi:hypothetical protein
MGRKPLSGDDGNGLGYPDRDARTALFAVARHHQSAASGFGVRATSLNKAKAQDQQRNGSAMAALNTAMAEPLDGHASNADNTGNRAGCAYHRG